MNGLPLVPPLPGLDLEQGQKALRMIGRLRLPDVPGQPLLKDALGEWFNPIVVALFGSFNAEENRRNISEVFMLIPKKNSKSTSAGAIMLTAMLLNRRPNAEAVIVAPTRKIAGISFTQLRLMIELDPALTALFHVQVHLKRITHRGTGATLEILSADTSVATGGKQAYTLIDETHVFAQSAKAADIFTELRGALAARPDGFLIQITTQSKSAPAGVFKAELDRARRVRDGLERYPLLPILYELPRSERERWDTEENLARVNPNLGLSVDRQFLMKTLASKRTESNAALIEFASQHANKEIGLDLGSDAWAGAEFWSDQGDPVITLDYLLDWSEVIVVGIDGGGLDDLLALAALGRHRVTKKWMHWGKAWAHPIVLQRRQSEAPRLLDFDRNGDLKIVGEIGQDIGEIGDIVARIEETGLLAQVGLDPMGVGAIVDELDNRGISGPDRVVAVSQGWQMTNMLKTAERKLADGTLQHGAQPIMAWAVGNVKIEPRGNAVIATKQAAGYAKIDPFLAMLNAINLMSRNPDAHRSVYEDQTVRWV